MTHAASGAAGLQCFLWLSFEMTCFERDPLTSYIVDSVSAAHKRERGERKKGPLVVILGRRKRVRLYSSSSSYASFHPAAGHSARGDELHVSRWRLVFTAETFSLFLSFFLTHLLAI